jgi:hypothetical protein
MAALNPIFADLLRRPAVLDAPTKRQLALRLDDAFTAFLDGERDGDAWVAAYDTREEGYELAEKAFGQADRDAFIEAALDEVQIEAEAYLIGAACRFRLAELDEEARNAELGKAA